MNAFVGNIQNENRPRTAQPERQDIVLNAAFILLPGFDALTLTAATAPLRMWNRSARPARCIWTYHALGGGKIRSSDGWQIDTDPLDDSIWSADHIILVGGEAITPDDTPLPDLVRKLWRRGKSIVGLQSGLFVLARSGILQGRRIAVHADHIPAFMTMWPDLTPRAELYCVDDRVKTCAGGMAAADLMIHTIRALGVDLRPDMKQVCNLTGHRPEGAPQEGSLNGRSMCRNPVVLRATEWLQDNFLDEECVSALPEIIGTSSRQLQRLFKTHLQTSPKGYVTELRMQRAMALLTHSNLPVSQIAAACGYDNTSGFARVFRKTFGTSPGHYGKVDPA